MTDEVFGSSVHKWITDIDSMDNQGIGTDHCFLAIQNYFFVEGSVIHTKQVIEQDVIF